MTLPESSISATTIDAYLATRYTVLAGVSFDLRIDCPSPELARIFELNQRCCAAFITAWNPLSVLTSDAENHTAQKKLVAEIRSCGLQYLNGEGADPSEQWPREPSLLIFGLSLESAKDLARKFNQNGFVYAGSDATPHLVLLR